jgi:hypothetical protein
MSETHPSPLFSDEPGIYEIRLRGHLDPRWASQLEGMRFTHQSDGSTVLSGRVADQSALHGLLRRLRDLALPLLSVNRIDPEPAPASDHKP